MGKSNHAANTLFLFIYLKQPVVQNINGLSHINKKGEAKQISKLMLQNVFSEKYSEVIMPTPGPGSTLMLTMINVSGSLALMEQMRTELTELVAKGKSFTRNLP